MNQVSLPKEKTLFEKNKILRSIRRDIWLYVLCIPFVAYYLIFHYIPMYGAVIAFKEYDIASGIMASPWVGMDNFIEFFNDYNFVRIIRNTLLISLYNLIFGFPAPIIFALLLNELRNKAFKKVVQTVTYLPHFISLIVVCGMLIDFLSKDGMLSVFMQEAFGIEAKYYFNYPQYFRTIYVASGIWQGIGWGSIIYLAALAGIDVELYEAAVIDGAKKFKQTIYITLPCIAPTIITLLILELGKLMSVGYEKTILLYNGNTYETADILSTYVYRLSFGVARRYSYTTAIGLFTSLINLILLISANKISKKISDTSLW